MTPSFPPTLQMPAVPGHTHGSGSFAWFAALLCPHVLIFSTFQSPDFCDASTEPKAGKLRVTVPERPMALLSVNNGPAQASCTLNRL